MTKKFTPAAQREFLKLELRALRAEKRATKLEQQCAKLEAENHHLKHDAVVTPAWLAIFARIRREVVMQATQGEGNSPALPPVSQAGNGLPDASTAEGSKS